MVEALVMSGREHTEKTDVLAREFRIDFQTGLALNEDADLFQALRNITNVIEAGFMKTFLNSVSVTCPFNGEYVDIDVLKGHLSAGVKRRKYAISLIVDAIHCYFSEIEGLEEFKSYVNGLGNVHSKRIADYLAEEDIRNSQFPNIVLGNS